MNVTFCCPQCSQSVRTDFAAGAAAIHCPACGIKLPVKDGHLHGDQVQHCLICPSEELFTRKDFSQRLGVTIVLIGFAISTWAWFNYYIYVSYGVLFVTALVDIVLYLTMGECLNCYRCHAVYRGTDIAPHKVFDLATHERYRQLNARLTPSQGTSHSR